MITNKQQIEHENAQNKNFYFHKKVFNANSILEWVYNLNEFQDHEIYHFTVTFLPKVNEREILVWWFFEKFLKIILQKIFKTKWIGRKNIHDNEPKLLVFLDHPNFKRKYNKKKRTLKSETGFHFHCIVLVQREFGEKRLSDNFEEFIYENKTYLNENFGLLAKKYAQVKEFKLQKIQTEADLIRVIEYDIPYAQYHPGFYSFSCYPKTNSEIFH